MFSKLGFLFFVLILSLTSQLPVLAQLQPGYEKGINTISDKEIIENISFLASDSLKGRASGSQENLIAAMFIANKFKEYGLTPLIKTNRPTKQIFDDEDNTPLEIEDSKIFNEYFQRFIIKRSQLSENNSLKISSRIGTSIVAKSFDYNSDFLVQKNTAENLSSTLPLVFAGYGIIDEENKYNDYLDSDGKLIDVKNKAVIIIDGFPRETDSASTFSKSKNLMYRNLRKKVELAESMGALAVIVIQSSLKNESPLTIKYESMINAFNRKIDYIPEITASTIPVFYAGKNFVDEVFRNTKLKLKTYLTEVDEELNPVAIEFLGKEISYSINFNSELLYTQNVVGFIEGTDPELKNEFVVLGAHYDHVGFGYYGSMDKKNVGQIHNGADDNASGTTAIIELAEAFSKSPPKRSIILIAFSGEENGLLGSKYYVHQQPLKPLDKTIAMLNLDMISRNESDLLWVGGAFYSDDLKTIVEQANKQTGFELLYNMGLLSGASDQAPFLKKEIPALFFFSGMHDEYHTPSDDIEKVNTKKIEKVSRLAFMSGWIVANGDSKPNFRKLSNDEKAALVKESLTRQKKFRNEN